MDDVVGESAVQYSARWPHLSRPPVIEALIDIAVEAREGIDDVQIEALFPAESVGFYLKGNLVEGMFTFGVAPEGSAVTPASDVRVVGRRYHSRDEKFVLQLRPDRFVLSRLAPYESWNKLVEEARRVWKVYVESVSPIQTVRVAVRYINSVTTPTVVATQWNAHLRKVGDLPEGIPATVETHFQRTQIVNSARDARVVLSIAIEPGPSAVLNTTIDIDAFSELHLSCADDRIWNRLAKLRDLKNLVFFKTLAEKTIEDMQ